MGTDAAIQAELRRIIEGALRGEVSKEQAVRVYEMGEDAVCAFVLAAAGHFAKLSAPGPHTPPGAVPPYLKPAATTRAPRSKRRYAPTPPPAHSQTCRHESWQAAEELRRFQD